MVPTVQTVMEKQKLKTRDMGAHFSVNGDPCLPSVGCTPVPYLASTTMIYKKWNTNKAND